MTGNAKRERSAYAVMLVASVFATLPIATTAVAVTVDGRVTAGDGYTIMKDLSFTVENVSGTQTGATLWLHQDGDLFVAFALPKSLVDNSYGSTAIGWGGNHKFQQLVGSDDARFVFKDTGGATLFDVTMDYLHGLGNKQEDPPYVGGKPGKQFEVTTGHPDDVLFAATSLAYNWDTLGGTNPGFFGKDSNSPAADPDYGNPTVPGWLYEVMYEFQIDSEVFLGSTIDLASEASVTIPLVHASPNKIGKNKVEDFVVENTEVIPEPVTMAGMLMGVGSLLAYVRRRSR